jgi:hypothetical protein
MCLPFFISYFPFIYYPKAIARAVGSSVTNPCPVIKVVSLDNAAFLLVPPAPSSTIIKSDVVKSAPMSVPPSISNVTNPTVLLEFVIVLFVNVCVAAIPAIVSVAAGKVNVVLPENAECAGA